jgi:hypothetical protein
MNPIEKQKTDAMFAELTKHERQFLEEQGVTPNEHGAYAFSNQDKSCHVALDLFLASYLNWLIENDIVKEI